MNITANKLKKDLDYVLFVLSLGQSVTVLKNGAAVGVLNPVPPTAPKKPMCEHPFFGMRADETMSVEEEVRKLRRRRYSDI